MMPQVAPKYDIGFVVKNCSASMLYTLEPWCSTIYTDWGFKTYIEEEQFNTMYDLKERVKSRLEETPDNDIIVEFDTKELNNDNFNFIVNLPMILQDSGELGEMKYDIFKFKINSLKTYEKDLIVND